MASRMYLGLFTALSLILTASVQAQQNAAPADPSRVVVQGLRDQSKWFRAESPHFVVFSDTSFAKVSLLLNNLERFDHLLRTYTRVPASAAAGQKLTFYYEARQSALSPYGKERPAEAVALFSSCPDGIQAFGTELEPITELEGDQLVNHMLNDSLDYIFEAYARHFIYRHTDIRAPISYIDGFAHYFSSVRFTKNEAVLGRVPVGIGRFFRFLDSGQPYELEYQDVLEGKQSKPGGASARIEYQSKAWLLTNFMMSSDDNRKRMRAYLNLINKDTPAAQAFEQAFGLPMSKVSETLWRYRLKGTQVYRGELPGMADVAVDFTPMTTAAGEFVLAEAALKACPGPNLGPELLQRVDRQAREYPTSEHARLTLSRAQVDWGNPADALAYLDGAVRAAKAGYDALYLHGQANLRLAERASGAAKARHLDTARASLQRAAALRPGAPEVAFALLKLEASAGSAPPQPVLDGVLAAWRNAHEVTELAQSAVLVHAYRDNAVDAWRALRLVEQNTRAPDGVQWARDLKARLAKGMTRASLVQEMARLSAQNGGFREWTVANRDLLKAAETKAGLKNLRRFLEGQNNPPGQNGMPEAAPILPMDW
jgi:hypothetical protein